MVTYLFIGIVFTFLMDLLSDHLNNIGMPQRSLTNWERLTCVIIWPVGVTIFLVSFIKGKFKK
jgi:hypothetical protein